MTAAIAAEPGITIGDPIGDRLPIVLETASARDGAAIIERMAQLEGVMVDIVAIDFSDEESAS